MDLRKCSYYLALKMLFEFFFNEYDSVSDLVRKNAWTMSESQFLSIIHRLDGNRFLRRMRNSILSKYKGKLIPQEFVLAIDDTDNPKYSQYLSGVQTWKSSKGFFHGQKILVIALVHTKSKFALPLFYRICLPKNEQEEKGGKSEIDLAFEIATLAAKEFKILPVVADSWFDSSDLAVRMRSLGITYVWELKSNRKVKNSPGRSKKWISLPNIFASIERSLVNSAKNKWISESVIVLKSSRTQVKAVAAYNRKNGKDALHITQRPKEACLGQGCGKSFETGGI